MSDVEQALEREAAARNKAVALRNDVERARKRLDNLTLRWVEAVEEWAAARCAEESHERRG